MVWLTKYQMPYLNFKFQSDSWRRKTEENEGQSELTNFYLICQKIWKALFCVTLAWPLSLMTTIPSHIWMSQKEFTKGNLLSTVLQN